MKPKLSEPRTNPTKSVPVCQGPMRFPQAAIFLHASWRGETPASTPSSVMVPDTHPPWDRLNPVPFPKSHLWLWLQLSTHKEAAIHRGGHLSLWLSGGQCCLLQAENQRARANDNEWPVRMHQCLGLVLPRGAGSGGGLQYSFVLHYLIAFPGHRATGPA